MNARAGGDSPAGVRGSGPRWLLGVEPLLEGGWRHKGERARTWDVEDRVAALAVLGDVTVDLVNARSVPDALVVTAYALGRDVNVFVTPNTRVELTGRADSSHVHCDVPLRDAGEYVRTATIAAYPWLGDVNVHFIAERRLPRRPRSRFVRVLRRPAPRPAVGTLASFGDAAPPN